ncbi:FCD domain-containing protein [Microbacterium sp. H1-D42]|uniref:FadR/GntR family transcriptional regulator n=1 Tax=Microbacterium sp. H1-D42 TaxID=2925844 RepID=UPI001F53A685|nr:FCD domain-containing protein [Microbacterium sp. H1-D42]UNK70323.1 FCD domain-containing protein [Microbacterium sp. H1-D42]
MTTRRRGLHGAMVDDLGRRIVHGELAAGSALPLDALGTEYEVSRTVVRETMRVLEAKGLVTARQNVGTRVQDASAWQGLDVDVIRWRLRGPGGDDARRELLELRSAVEPVVAGLAAQRASDAALQALTSTAVRLEDALAAGDVDAFVAADVEFHAALFAAAGNSMLDDLASLVAEALGDRRTAAQAQGISPAAIAAHRRLADAVAAGDQVAATTAMSDILSSQDD